MAACIYVAFEMCWNSRLPIMGVPFVEHSSSSHKSQKSEEVSGCTVCEREREKSRGKKHKNKSQKGKNGDGVNIYSPSSRPKYGVFILPIWSQISRKRKLWGS